MKPYWLLLPAWLVWFYPAVAQPPGLDYSDTTRVDGLARPPRWVVSLAPLALLDPDNTVQFGVERLLKGKFSVLGEVGYGPPGMNVWRYDRSDPGRETWRGRLEGRIYTRRSQIVSRWGRFRRVTEKPLGNYVALDLFYKQVNANQEGSIGRACEDGTCQYYQRFQARAVKYVWGAHVKIGKQAVLFASETGSRFVTDVYVGLGLRRRLVQQYGRPEPEDAGTFFITNGNEFSGVVRGDPPVIVSVAAGLRVGYVF